MSGKTYSTTRAYSDAELDAMADDMLDSAEGRKPSSSYRYSGGRDNSYNAFVKCAHKHPPLRFKGKDGSDYVIHGGACRDPIHTGLDIYVALDHGTACDTRAYPWHGSRQFVFFPISDMSVPKDEVEFQLMVEWLCAQMVAGKSVHVGCIGGHGRTGMVLAAVVNVLGGIEDAVTYVRDHYCEKAVETDAQSNWLHKHFGIKKVTGHKTHGYGYKSSGWDGDLLPEYPKGMDPKPKSDTRLQSITADMDKVQEVKPFRVKGNIWGMTY